MTETNPSGPDLSRTRRVWQRLGERDPMWAVLSDPDQDGGRWDEDEFFRSGAAHIQNLIDHMDRHGMTPTPGRALDFGCGMGRLSQALADHFDEVDGVDIAASMVELARQRNRHGPRCRYHVNERADLELFDDDTFDVAHSCITLQHIPPDASLAYVREFVRVTRPGGAVVFQLPSEPRALAPAAPLPDGEFRAGVELLSDAPDVVRPGETLVLSVRITNLSDVRWPANVEGGAMGEIRVANRWRRTDGSLLQGDDGRAQLPVDLPPSAEAIVELRATVPSWDGPLVMSLDIVQEHVGWFSDHGSPTDDHPITVAGGPAVRARLIARGVDDRMAGRLSTTVRSARRVAGVARRSVVGALDRAPATAPVVVTDPVESDDAFDMFGVPTDEVAAVLEAAGAQVVATEVDPYAGPSWVSITYYATVAGTR